MRNEANAAVPQPLHDERRQRNRRPSPDRGRCGGALRNEASELITLPDADDNPDAVTAFDTIGTALYDLRDKLTAMQQEHRREIDRQIVPEN